jgi:hypothetical protein
LIPNARKALEAKELELVLARDNQVRFNADHNFPLNGGPIHIKSAVKGFDQ